MGGGGKGGGGGSGGGGSGTTEVRFAPYVETHHQNFLNTMATEVAGAIHSSPFAGYTDIEFEEAFFSAGYAISDFPSLYDMFGKFMAGLDIEVVWNQLFENTTNGAVQDALVQTHATELSDDLDNIVYPKFVVGMRDVNSVMSSTFVVGKAMLERARQRELSKFSAELKYRLIPIAEDRWKTHLEWNKNVVMDYAQIMKFYFASAIDVSNRNYEMASKNLLWPFTVLEYQRAAVGALNGATNTKTDVAGASTGSKVLGGALAGAAAGAMIGSVVPGIGTVAGAIGGGVLGAASGLL